MSKEIRELINKVNTYNQLNENKEIDCSSFFDIDKIYVDYVEFDKPLYSMMYKRKTAKLHYMSPKQYIHNIARNFGVSYDDTVNYDTNVIKNNVFKYAEAMKKGNKFPVPYYNTDNDYQEGRHRALAAIENGCTLIPVIEFSKISDEDVTKWAYEFKDKSFEELDEIFIDMGFKNGITGLGYGDLNRYIRYNL